MNYDSPSTSAKDSSGEPRAPEDDQKYVQNRERDGNAVVEYWAFIKSTLPCAFCAAVCRIGLTLRGFPADLAKPCFRIGNNAGSFAFKCSSFFFAHRPRTREGKDYPLI
jgi:hypothetical protein